jgi:hypothetical protein
MSLEDLWDGKIKDSRSTLNSCNAFLGEGNGLFSKEILLTRASVSGVSFYTLKPSLKRFEIMSFFFALL